LVNPALVMKDEKLVSKMEGKTIFFQALETYWRLYNWLTWPPSFYNRSTLLV